MKHEILYCPQRSPEWFAARAGRVTGSQAAAVTSKGRGKAPSRARQELIEKLAVERMLVDPVETELLSKHVARGKELEPHAIRTYAARYGLTVESTGFLRCTEIMAGCSLDGAVRDPDSSSRRTFVGIQEVKCPGPMNHARWSRDGGVPKEHLPQVMHNLLISEADWADFISYDDRFPSDKALFVARVWARDLDLASYETALRKLLDEVSQWQ